MSDLSLVQPPCEETCERYPFQEEFLANIDDVDEYCKNRGLLGGLDTGFELMTRHLDGLQPGLILFAGSPNAGKSAIMCQIAIQAAQVNSKTFCLYHSLDDNSREIVPRFIANMERIPINSVKFPERYKTYPGGEVTMTKRARGMNTLRELSNRILIRDQLYGGNGSDIEVIEKSVREVKCQLPEDHELILFIDNFHDLTTSEVKSGDDKVKYDYLSDKLSAMATLYKIPIVCSAEFRKLNGFRRPTVDDVRETTKIAYEAKAILLCYNEVGIKGEQANVFWNDRDPNVKLPVLEIKFGKNKLSSFKGRLFYNFVPETSSFSEVPEEGCLAYNARVNG